MTNAGFSFFEAFPVTPHLTIVDVGAAITSLEPERYEALLRAGAARAFLFEPDPTERKRLEDRQTPNVSILPYFVGDGSDAVYHATNVACTGSLFPPNTELLERFFNLAEVTRLISRRRVKMYRLQDMEEIQDIDFLKLDVQGSELALLQGTGEKPDRAVMAQIEIEFVPLYCGQPLFSDGDAFMRAKGWAFHTFLNFDSRCFKPLGDHAKPNRGIRQVLWCDAIYIRDFMRWAEMPRSKAIRLAALRYDLLASCDACAAILRKIDGRHGTSLAETYVRHLRA